MAQSLGPQDKATAVTQLTSHKRKFSECSAQPYSDSLSVLQTKLKEIAHIDALTDETNDASCKTNSLEDADRLALQRESLASGHASPASTQVSQLERSDSVISTVFTSLGSPTTAPSSCATPASLIALQREQHAVDPTSQKSCGINIYPCSNSLVPSIYKERFKPLEQRLRKNIEPTLGSQTGSIGIKLVMCGTSENDLRPSVVIFGEMTIMKKVQKRLTHSKVLKNKDCPLEELPSKTVLGSPSRFEKIPLGIVFHGCKAPYIEQCSEDDLLYELDSTTSPDFEQQTTLCGLKVSTAQGSKLSTIAGIIQLGSKQVVALTTAHGHRESSKRMQSCDQTLSGFSAQVTCIITASVQINDPVPSESTAMNIKNDSVEAVMRMPERDAYTADFPDFDYTLIELNNEDLLKENMFSLYAACLNRFPIVGVADDDIDLEVDVLILNSQHSPMRGVLLQGQTTWTKFASRPVKVWNVELHADYSIRKGDSGSMVIDPQTGLAYGYVVAVDTFGQLQVMPLKPVLHQISNLSGQEHVTLADVNCLSKQRDLLRASKRLCPINEDHIDGFSNKTQLETTSPKFQQQPSQASNHRLAPMGDMVSKNPNWSSNLIPKEIASILFEGCMFDNQPAAELQALSQVTKQQVPVVDKLQHFFKCSQPGCEFQKKGFSSGTVLAQHLETVHKEKEPEDGLEFALEMARKAFDLDANGNTINPDYLVKQIEVARLFPSPEVGQDIVDYPGLTPASTLFGGKSEQTTPSNDVVDNFGIEDNLESRIPITFGNDILGFSNCDLLDDMVDDVLDMSWDEASPAKRRKTDCRGGFDSNLFSRHLSNKDDFF